MRSAVLRRLAPPRWRVGFDGMNAIDPAPLTADSSTAGSLSGLVICVVACNFRPDLSGIAPYNSLLVDALAEAGATVRVVTGVPHYPQWRVVDPHYRLGLSWREEPTAAAGNGSVRILRLRHAVPRKPDLLGRLRLELSFAMLSAPVVAA